jgi:hypothetical protein
METLQRGLSCISDLFAAIVSTIRFVPSPAGTRAWLLFPSRHFRAGLWIVPSLAGLHSSRVRLLSLFHRCQHGSALVLHQKHYELC